MAVVVASSRGRRCMYKVFGTLVFGTLILAGQQASGCSNVVRTNILGAADGAVFVCVILLSV